MGLLVHGGKFRWILAMGDGGHEDLDRVVPEDGEVAEGSGGDVGS